MREILEICIPIAVGIFAAWGMLWYRVGKLSQEVRDHNKMLSKVVKKLDAIAVKEGINEPAE